MKFLPYIGLTVAAAAIVLGLIYLTVKYGRRFVARCRVRAEARQRQREAERLAQMRVTAPWISYVRREGQDWVIGVHRRALGDAEPFDEREMYRFPVSTPLYERLEAEGEAIGRAADFNQRREGFL